MNRLKTLARQLFRDEQGQDMIEYALLGALIALGVVAALGPLANAIVALFQRIQTALGAT